MATQDDFIRTALRVPPDLHKQIHEAAEQAHRTFNAEIVARLQQSFSAPPKLADCRTGELIDELERRYPKQMQVTLGRLDEDEPA